MKKIILALAVMLAVTVRAQVPPLPAASPAEVAAGVLRTKAVTPYSLGQSGVLSGGGGMISNSTSVAATPASVIYTNATDYYAYTYFPYRISGGSNQVSLSVTNPDNTRFYQYINGNEAQANMTNHFFVSIPPRAWYKVALIGVGTLQEAANQVITYFSTNSVSGGSSSGVSAAEVAAVMKTNGAAGELTTYQCGAVGDGTTDDTVALQNWLTWAGNSNLIAKLPPAVGSYYKITAPLYVTNAVKIVGTGGQRHDPGVGVFTKAQIRQFGVGSSGIIVTNFGAGYGQTFDNFEIHDAAITCDSAAYTYDNQFGIGLLSDSSDLDNVEITRCYVAGFGKGVGIVGTSVCYLKNCDIANNGDNVYSGAFGAVTVPVINSIGINGGSVSHSYTNNFLLNNSGNVTIDTVDIATSSARNQYAIRANSCGLLVMNVNIEYNSTNKPACILSNTIAEWRSGKSLQQAATGVDTYFISATNSHIYIGGGWRNSIITTDGFQYIMKGLSDDDTITSSEIPLVVRNTTPGFLWTNYVAHGIQHTFPGALGTPTPSVPGRFQVQERLGGVFEENLLWTARLRTSYGDDTVRAIDLLAFHKQKANSMSNNIVKLNTLYATNFFSLATNYVAANWVPDLGVTKFLGSNDAVYSVSTRKTNLIVAP